MYPVVEQDETVARRAGELLAAADERAGGESGIGVDPMVAAVADLNGEPVVTDNGTDCQTLGVSVEQY